MGAVAESRVEREAVLTADDLERTGVQRRVVGRIVGRALADSHFESLDVTDTVVLGVAADLVPIENTVAIFVDRGAIDPQGWQWVDPKKGFDAMLTAIRAGLLSRTEAISAFGYDAEDIDREIAADNQRADELGLVFDSDPRHDKQPIAADLKPPDDPDISNA